MYVGRILTRGAGVRIKSFGPGSPSRYGTEVQQRQQVEPTVTER